jgi:conjugative relaxase-like TrwC/TraI family protein
MLASPQSVTSKNLGNYYTKDNYYFSEHGTFEALGEGAQKLGLKNGCSEEQIKALIKSRKLIAKDLTFSASKSFSLEHGLGHPEIRKFLDNAWRESIKEGVDFLEQSGLLTYKYRDGDKTRVGDASDCVVLPVHHNVNRELEPLLHTHVLVLNTGKDKFGRNHALDFNNIYRYRNAIGRVVDHAFARKIEEAGLKLRTKVINNNGKNEHYFELAHIDDLAIAAFSTRREQVLAREKEFRDAGKYEGVSGGELRQIAAKDSRKTKTQVNIEEVRKSWEITANEVSLKTLPLSSLLVSDRATMPIYDSLSTASKRLNDLRVVYDDAKITLVENDGAFTRLSLFKAAQESAVTSGKTLTIKDFNNLIKNDVDLFSISAEDVKPAHHQYVSRQFLVAEEFNMNAMVTGKQSHSSTLTNADEHLARFNDKLAKKLTAKGKTVYRLDPEQENAAKMILQSRDVICGIQGVAGSGKTTLLQAVQDISKDVGRKVFGIAPSAKAAMILEKETGIKSHTTDLFILQVRGAEERESKRHHKADLTGRGGPSLSRELTDGLQQALLPEKHWSRRIKDEELLKDIKGSMLIMDEASMCGTLKMREVIEIAKRHNMQIVLAGDKDQLSAVAAGKDFARFQDNGMSLAKLEIIRRQRDKGRGSDDQALLDVANTLAIKQDVSATFTHLSDLMKKEEAEGISAQDRRANVYEVSTARERLRMISKEFAEDLVNGKSSIVVTDKNKRRVELNREIRYFLQQKGMVDRSEFTVKVEGAQGGFSDRKFSVNDRIIFLKNDYKKLNVKNNETGTVLAIGKDENSLVNSIKVKMDDGRTVAFNPQSYARFDHGYSLTTHKSQGITVSKAIVELNSKSMNTFNKIYVGLSRHMQQVSLYVDNLVKVAAQGKNFDDKKSAVEELDKKLELARKIKATEEMMEALSPVVKGVLAAEKNLWIRQSGNADTASNAPTEFDRKAQLRALNHTARQQFIEEIKAVASENGLSAEYAHDCVRYLDGIKTEFFEDKRNNVSPKKVSAEEKAAQLEYFQHIDQSRPQVFCELREVQRDVQAAIAAISQEKKAEAAKLANQGQELSAEQKQAYSAKYTVEAQRLEASTEEIIQRHAKSPDQAKQIWEAVKARDIREVEIRKESTALTMAHGKDFNKAPKQEREAIQAKHAACDAEFEAQLKRIEAPHAVQQSRSHDLKPEHRHEVNQAPPEREALTTPGQDQKPETQTKEERKNQAQAEDRGVVQAPRLVPDQAKQDKAQDRKEMKPTASMKARPISHEQKKEPKIDEKLFSDLSKARELGQQLNKEVFCISASANAEQLQKQTGVKTFSPKEFNTLDSAQREQMKNGMLVIDKPSSIGRNELNGIGRMANRLNVDIVVRESRPRRVRDVVKTNLKNLVKQATDKIKSDISTNIANKAAKVGVTEAVAILKTYRKVKQLQSLLKAVRQVHNKSQNSAQKNKGKSDNPGKRATLAAMVDAAREPKSALGKTFEKKLKEKAVKKLKEIVEDTALSAAGPIKYAAYGVKYALKAAKEISDQLGGKELRKEHNRPTIMKMDG